MPTNLAWRKFWSSVLASARRESIGSSSILVSKLSAWSGLMRYAPFRRYLLARIRHISAMWDLLDVFTYDSAGQERRVNHLNEWGGFSRVLGMPVFTAWLDHTRFDRETKLTSAMVSDSVWEGNVRVGVNNQERWIDHALAHGGQAAFFVIHAVDVGTIPRKIREIDSERVIVGQIHREGTMSIVTGQPRQHETKTSWRDWHYVRRQKAQWLCPPSKATGTQP
jgi:hypothetical protein